MIDLDALKAAGLNSRENSECLLEEHRARQAEPPLGCYDCRMAAKGPHWPVFSTGCRGCCARALGGAGGG